MYAVTDLETTGLDPWRNEILTISTLIADENFQIVDEFNGRCRPSYTDQWSEEAEKVHGITRREADTFDDSSGVLGEYIRFLDNRSGGYHFTCHALPRKSSVDLIDRNFVFSWFWVNDRRVDYYRHFPEEKVTSTIKKRKKEAKDLWGMSSQSLKAWMDKLGIDSKSHHEARFDAWACLQILKYQKQGEIGG